MFISYRLTILYPPPSLRDTSAGGGYGMTFLPITTQSRNPGHPIAADIQNGFFYRITGGMCQV